MFDVSVKYAKKMTAVISVIIIITTVFTGCIDDQEFYNDLDIGYDENYNEQYYETNFYDEEERDSEEKLGSAKELDGTTVLVSIFADDINTSWETDENEENMYKTLDYLSIAIEWIDENCNRYGVDPEFVYDWSQYEDLYYTTSFEYDMTYDEDDQYFSLNKYVETIVDSENLKDKYQADNIIYMVYYNNDYSSTTVSATYCWINEDTNDYPYEIVNIYTRCDGIDENPASYAHEILHTFGAPDFYLADEDGQNYGITQEFVDYNEEICSNSIMFTTFDAQTGDAYYDKITNEFDDVVAYYVGLLSQCNEVEEWGLGKSQHIPRSIVD